LDLSYSYFLLERPSATQ